MLLCHPATPCTTPTRIEASIERSAERIALSYAMRADLQALQIPATTRSGRADGLWRHTCVEAFVRAAGEAQYWELNFSPSSEWAVYRFSGYRAGMQAVEAVSPNVTVHRHDGTLLIDAALTLAELDPIDNLDIGLTAVVEERSGQLSYWALAHPGAKPDFHDARGFVLTLGRALA
jgi:hypothetical protein